MLLEGVMMSWDEGISQWLKASNQILWFCYAAVFTCRISKYESLGKMQYFYEILTKAERVYDGL